MSHLTNTRIKILNASRNFRLKNVFVILRSYLIMSIMVSEPELNLTFFNIAAVKLKHSLYVKGNVTPL